MAPQSEWVSAFLAHFDEMDRALVAFGFPPTSPWWRSRLERFLRSGKKTKNESWGILEPFRSHSLAH